MDAAEVGTGEKRIGGALWSKEERRGRRGKGSGGGSWRSKKFFYRLIGSLPYWI